MDELRGLEQKAWDGLARRQFWIFGFYAARYMGMTWLWRRSTGETIASPFDAVVDVARRKWCGSCRQPKDDGAVHACGSRVPATR
jgi:hypothetical protein